MSLSLLISCIVIGAMTQACMCARTRLGCGMSVEVKGQLESFLSYHMGLELKLKLPGLSVSAFALSQFASPLPCLLLL